MEQKKPRGVVTMGTLLILAASVVGTCASLTVLKFGEGPTREALRKAERERDAAKKAEAEAKKQCDQALAVRQAAAEERDQAQGAEKAARRSLQNAKAVLTFLESNVFSASGNPLDWAHEGLGRNVTLRKALDAAEPKVAKECQYQPLVEASIREVFGSAYLELGEAKKAVQQYTRALALQQAELGPNHPDTIACRNQLAVAYRRAGRTDDASRLFEQYHQNDKGPDRRGARIPGASSRTLKQAGQGS